MFQRGHHPEWKINGYSFIGIYTLRQLTTENSLDRLKYTRHTYRATCKDDLIDVGGFNTHICQSLLAGFDGTLDKRCNK